MNKVDMLDDIGNDSNNDNSLVNDGSWGWNAYGGAPINNDNQIWVILGMDS